MEWFSCCVLFQSLCHTWISKGNIFYNKKINKLTILLSRLQFYYWIFLPLHFYRHLHFSVLDSETSQFGGHLESDVNGFLRSQARHLHLSQLLIIFPHPRPYWLNSPQTSDLHFNPFPTHHQWPVQSDPHSKQMPRFLLFYWTSSGSLRGVTTGRRSCAGSTWRTTRHSSLSSTRSLLYASPRATPYLQLLSSSCPRHIRLDWLTLTEAQPLVSFEPVATGEREIRSWSIETVFGRLASCFIAF